MAKVQRHPGAGPVSPPGPAPGTPRTTEREEARPLPARRLRPEMNDGSGNEGETTAARHGRAERARRQARLSARRGDTAQTPAAARLGPAVKRCCQADGYSGAPNFFSQP